MTLVFATRNRHKVEEVRALWGPHWILKTLDDIGLHDDIPEEQSTLEGNAHQKAQYVFDRCHLPCLADDTGLEVAALNGAPGVDSAHFAGPQRSDHDNVQKLLRLLENNAHRAARFRTVFCLVAADETRFFEGVLEGTIALEKRGSQGFGYDPVFQPIGETRTLAELSLAEKNRISHRARALQHVIQYLAPTRV